MADEPKKASDSRSHSVWPYLLASVAATGALVLAPIPLGVPGEWVWARRSLDGVWLTNLLVGLVIAAGYVVAIAFLLRDHGTHRRFRSSVAVLTLAAWLLVTLRPVAITGGTGAERAPLVLYYPGFSGYFTAAREADASTLTFLRGYDETVAEGDFLHQGTHPPGLILGYRALRFVVGNMPGIVPALEAIRLFPTDRSFGSLRELDPSLTVIDDAVLQAAGLLTTFAAAACVIPIALLLRPRSGELAALRWAAMWPLVPSLAIFSPKSDLLLAIVPLTVAWLWCRTGPRQTIAAAAAGMMAFVGLMISLAALPIYAGVLIGSLLTKDRPTLGELVAGAAGTFIPVVVLEALGVRIVAIWMQNLTNHAAFYDHNPRTAWAWLLVNVLEVAIALGLPILVLLRSSAALRDPDRTVRMTLGVCAGWAVLLLSGKNMGEAARLWIPFLPWFLVAIAISRPNLESRLWQTATVALVVASTLTIHAVDGFAFVDYLPSGSN